MLRKDVPLDAPKLPAIDFDLLELLLPGYPAENSKKVRQPAEALVYEPLPGPDWIRLLVIEPWSADENRLRCHLKAVRLDHAAGKYYALSYCWGQPVRGEAQSLLCNGRSVDAADNLRLALENIRYSTLPRIVWVDALCINQDDPAERSEQVQLMGKIYQQATETIVWLGDAFPSAKTRPEFEAICQVVKSWDSYLTPSYACRDAEGNLCHHQPDPSDDSSNPLRFNPALVASLFRCPWFSRRWVIQEVALARSAVVQVPGATIPWKWIGLAAGIIRTNYDHLIATYHMPNLYNAYLISRLSPHGPLPPLTLPSSPSSASQPTSAAPTPSTPSTPCSASSPLPPLQAGLHPHPLALSLQVAAHSLSQPRRPLAFLSDATGLAGAPTWAPTWGPDKPALLDSWSLRSSQNDAAAAAAANDDDDDFNPARGIPFARLRSPDPDRVLRVRGLAVSAVAWRAAHGVTVMHEANEDGAAGSEGLMDALAALARRCPPGARRAVGRALCAGRDWYGRRDREGKLAAQAERFVRSWGLCRRGREAELAAESEAFWSTRERRNRIRAGERMEWMEVAATVGRGRRLFYTASGHVGLGPEEMAVGDTVYVFVGAVMPVVVRQRGEGFGVVGDCYLDGIMDGEAADALKKGEGLRGPVLVDEESRQTQTQYEPLRLDVVSLC
ncbi:hypothetical protein NEMBOFW57_006677 [Staphylotrichum longicolle]|uniref:Heterokaryon incompatibility domain-containing protein n=1 Tax=Staphylotrichum longicolle TaxID=669026 RepID=A0AAD4ETE9_9PEZI|nr:hypothetical protein NEMBOFW57_006677 [Staphylotrichum longicolle]